MSQKPLSRRTLLRLAAAGLSSALFPLTACVKPLGQPHNAKQLPTPDVPLTPTDDWYSMSIQGAYDVDRASYRLKVVGLVGNELSIDDDALRSDFTPRVELATLACVGNVPGGALMSASLFRGAQVRDVAAAAAVSSDATGAMITGLDGFLAFRPMEELLREESLLVYDMGVSEADLAPLPIENGFPTRILTPGHYGYMQPKWIDSITFVDQGGYQDVLRRSIDYLEGKIELASGFTAPRGGTGRPGPRPMVGYAFGDGRPIAAVHVQVDGGAWQAAEIVWNQLDDDKPPYVWVLWQFTWMATPGGHDLTCRATYEDGETQIQGMSFPYSGGSLMTIHIDVSEAA